MCLDACVGLWMRLVLGVDAELSSLYLHNKRALHEVSMYMGMCVGYLNHIVPWHEISHTLSSLLVV